MVSFAITALAAFLSAVGITEITRRVVLSREVLAHPNERSSHSVPTPTAGGIGIVVPVIVASFVWLPGDALRLSVVLGGAGVALVSLLDDVVEVRRSVRFVVHLLASGVCVVMGLGIEGLPAVAVILAVAWSLNLYNFMDGIDGIAASQALAFGLGAILFVPWDSAFLPVLAAVAAASIGFLLFNWAPARIFMGDVGAGFLGLTIAVLALALAMNGDLTIVVSLVLLCVFWVDASYTLGVRVVTGQRFTEGHRSHLYQIASRRLGHGRTVAGFWAFFLCWCLPCAWLAHRFENWQYVALGLAIAPLLIACVRLGAGTGAVRVPASSPPDDEKRTTNEEQ